MFIKIPPVTASAHWQTVTAPHAAYVGYQLRPQVRAHAPIRIDMQLMRDPLFGLCGCIEVGILYRNHIVFARMPYKIFAVAS